MSHKKEPNPLKDWLRNKVKFLSCMNQNPIFTGIVRMLIQTILQQEMYNVGISALAISFLYTSFAILRKEDLKKKLCSVRQFHPQRHLTINRGQYFIRECRCVI